MDTSINIDKVAKDVAIEKRGDGYVFTVEGREHVVSDVQRAPGTITFIIDHRSLTAHYSGDGSATRISIGGRNYRVVEDARDSELPGPAAAGGDGRVESPMPGSIVAVHVEAGQEVEAGQPMVVLESMKMQNEITAPVAGKVARVGCKPGDQVGFGHVLVQIEAAE